MYKQAIEELISIKAIAQEYLWSETNISKRDQLNGCIDQATNSILRLDIFADVVLEDEILHWKIDIAHTEGSLSYKNGRLRVLEFLFYQKSRDDLFLGYRPINLTYKKNTKKFETRVLVRT